MTRYLFQYQRRKSVQSSSTLNLGKCYTCGTFNPSVPGHGLAEKCSGCGTPLHRDEFLAPEKAFTAKVRKKGKSTLNGSSK